ncbi:serine hydrolase domain-containing protein [Fimbriiglobus ruber]|uniref:Beta-lactamase n=1 Tax=Fimbriiglobus ruber TaxID=1908690 RepID=A0A225DB00_9BACT|nr:serine hydrolase domain-containing protein [Fimbriiglobus ruber]OWK38153.1 Beta-lactamase [Fimbriiglobus ruber]
MFSRRVLFALAALPLIAPLTPAQAPTEAAARAVIQAPLGFKPYVFSADEFPACRFDKPEEVEKAVGAFQITSAYYDRDGKRATTAAAPGPYFAVVTVTAKRFPPLTRYFTLYRLPKVPDLGAKLDTAKPEAIADLAGVKRETVAANAKLIAEVVKTRPLSDLASDPKFARLLAGLAVAPAAGAGPVTKQNDALACERQAWVTRRRTLTGLDKEFPAALTAPTPAAKPVAVVRSGTAAEAGVKADAAAKIDAVLADWAAHDDQAFAVCVVRRGVIVLHKAYGTRDGKPMTVDTPSWMASVTKAMSATLMLTLVDRGLVRLDDPVDKFVPALRGVKVDKPLLIRHLYTHTNGLDKWPGWDDTLSDVECRLANYYPFVKVGTAWAYNGGGYTLGGKVIENVTGEAVPLAFKRHLLDPLECRGTEVVGTHADAFSVPLDMAKFGQLLLNRGSYGGHQFYKPETFEQALPRKLTTELGPKAEKTFGFGLDGSPRKFGHGAASAATFHVDVDRELVVVMTRNRQGMNQDKYNGKFWDAINAAIEK